MRTTHDSTSWNVHRETLTDHAHEVDGVQYIGGRGVRLDSLLERTYVEEANQLGNDLATCLAALPPHLAHHTLEGMKGALGQAAGGRHDMRAAPPITGEVAVVAGATVVDVGPDATAVDLPAEMATGYEPRRRKGRGKDDVVAALAEQRGPTTGEVVVDVDSDATA